MPHRALIELQMRPTTQREIAYSEPVQSYKEPVQVLPSELLDARTVAIVREGGLGDAIMATAGIHRLLELYPYLQIDYYTSEHFLDLFSGDPYLFDVRPAQDHDKRYYDKNIDLSFAVERSKYDESMDRVTLFSMKICKQPPSEAPKIFLTPIEGQRRSYVTRLLGMTQTPKIAIAPWSNRIHSDWPEEHVQTLVNLLRARGVHPYLVDNRPDRLRRIHGAIPVKIDLLQLGHFIKEMDALVSTDSGIYHLANAVNADKPFKIVMFSTVMPCLRMRWYSNYVALMDADRPCLGCNMNPTCQPPVPCMTAITPDRIVDVLETRLQF